MSDGELSDEDKEWMDAPMGPPHRLSIASQLGAIYDHALIKARAAAFANGYAIAVHGSEMRDLDLIAVPWTDEATSAETLVAEIVRLTGGRIGQEPDTARPHGRRSWSIHLNNEHTLGNFKPVLPYIDLSVMPRAASSTQEDADRAGASTDGGAQ